MQATTESRTRSMSATERGGRVEGVVEGGVAAAAAAAEVGVGRLRILL